MAMEERSLHLRLQEYCDCYVQTDYKNQLELISKEGAAADATGEMEEVALKFLGLAIMHGITEGAKKVSLIRTVAGHISFEIEAAGKYKLPAPKPELADRMFRIMRSITHLEGAKAGEPLSLGLKNDRLELMVSFDTIDGTDSLTIGLPE